jgi:hypothetical protein
LGFKSEKLSLERLSGIYAAVSAYTELTYVNLDGDIDMKDEIAIYAEKLRSY